ncbi:AraC family ligand binding domain-containing protein [Cohnella rhizosphaerae]|uniref:AraC family ligand binding domain-containing protein n=1 Tax=Cohnella rhizosphaerae TaxID=1457232 RepID=UPI003B8A694A
MDSTDYGMLVYTPSQLARSTFLYVQHIGRWKYDDDYVITREGFDSYLFQYTFSGRGYLKHEDREYELLADSVILIDCRKYHEYGTLSNEQWDVGWVHFDGNGSASYMQAIHDKYGPVIRLPVPHRFIQHQRSLIEIIRGNGVNLEAEAALHIFQLLMEVFTAGTTSPFRQWYSGASKRWPRESTSIPANSLCRTYFRRRLGPRSKHEQIPLYESLQTLDRVLSH